MIIGADHPQLEHPTLVTDAPTETTSLTISIQTKVMEHDSLVTIRRQETDPKFAQKDMLNS
jgi:hypothetical protein